MSLRRFIFLDNWVISNYTHGNWRAELSSFLKREDLVVLITSLLMTELYNPKGRRGDRVSRAIEFLAAHRTVVVDPQRVRQAEIQAYPTRLLRLPLELDLDKLPAAHRARALELLLRRDPIYLQQGKDIAQWKKGYDQLKAGWRGAVDQIIQDAIKQETLAVDSRGEFVDLVSSKENFLTTLDRRHFLSLTSEELEALGPRLVPLFLGDTRELLSIRLSSLCFWYAYVDVDRANLMRQSGSDIGDFQHLSLAPYCAYFTLDKTMLRLMKRVSTEHPIPAVLLSKQDLEQQLTSQ